MIKESGVVLLSHFGSCMTFTSVAFIPVTCVLLFLQTILTSELSSFGAVPPPSNPRIIRRTVMKSSLVKLLAGMITKKTTMKPQSALFSNVL